MCGWLAVLCGFVLLYFLDVSFDTGCLNYILNPTSGILIRRIGFHMLSYFHTGQPLGGSRLLPSGLLLLRQVPKTVDREISQAGAGHRGLKRAQNPSQIAETMA